MINIKKYHIDAYIHMYDIIEGKNTIRIDINIEKLITGIM